MFKRTVEMLLSIHASSFTVFDNIGIIVLYQTCDDWISHSTLVSILIVLGKFPEPARERHRRLQTLTAV